VCIFPGSLFLALFRLFARVRVKFATNLFHIHFPHGAFHESFRRKRPTCLGVDGGCSTDLSRKRRRGKDVIHCFAKRCVMLFANENAGFVPIFTLYSACPKIAYMARRVIQRRGESERRNPFAALYEVSRSLAECHDGMTTKE
jgi:hypothetical protein